MPTPRYRLEFYEDPAGTQPVRQWLRTELSPEGRRTVGAAMLNVLQEQGAEVCGSSSSSGSSAMPTATG